MTARADPGDGAPRSRADLFWSFSWLALQGFGGVLAVVQRELVEKKRWLSNAQFIEDWAVAQILPGPNVVNLSIMLGARHFGASGALAALAGMLTLPTLLIAALAVAWSTFTDVPIVQQALRGIGAVAAGLILGTAIKLLAALRFNPMGLAASLMLLAATIVASALLHLPLAWTVALLGGAGWAWAAGCLRRQARAATRG